MAGPGGVRGRSSWSACLLIVVGACSEDSTAPTAPPAERDTVVSSIEMNPPERTIGILGTQFVARAFTLNEGGETLYRSHQDPGPFSWSTSSSDVATIDGETGVVRSSATTGRTPTASAPPTACLRPLLSRAR